MSIVTPDSYYFIFIVTLNLFFFFFAVQGTNNFQDLSVVLKTGFGGEEPDLISLSHSFLRVIHAAVIKSALWERTATVLSTPRPAASPAAGERSAAIETACAALATAAATVRS